MQYKEGARVYFANGDEAGHVERVVIDPKSLTISDIIVRRGGLLHPQEKVIPVAMIARAEGEDLHLAAMEGGWDELLPFEEKNYRLVNDQDFFLSADLMDFSTPVVFAYPPTIPATGAANPPGNIVNDTSAFQAGVDQSYISETRRNIPDENVALKPGAKVISQDGVEMGNVERFITRAEDGRVTHLVLKRGVLVKEHKLVPFNWVEEVLENEVRLGVRARFLDWLPDESPDE